MPMPMQHIQQLIAENRISEAIQELLAATENTHLHTEVIQQSAKFEHYNRERRNGTTSEADLNVMLAKIQTALLAINEKLDNATTPKSVNLWKYIIGAAVIIGMIAGTIKIIDFFSSDTPANSATNTVTILVHGTDGKDDVVLPNRGIVYLLYGDAKIPEQINNEGEATFKQIPESFFQENTRVEILFQDPEGEPYRAVYRDSLYQLQKKQSIYLEVQLEGMEQINGVVKDFETGKTIDSAEVRIFGTSVYTNQRGEFVLIIPPAQQRRLITVRAYKEGYKDWEMTEVPTTTGEELVIPMRK